MIVVKIELHSAITHQVSEIGRMYLANDGSKSERDPKLGDYLVAVSRRGSDEIPSPVDPDGPAPVRSAAIYDYPRLAYNVWRLIARAVTAAFPEERTPPKSAKTLLGGEIMRGLAEIARLARGELVVLTDAQKIALEWIAAGERA